MVKVFLKINLNKFIIKKIQKISSMSIKYELFGTTQELRLTAKLYEPKSGRTMELLTTKPGIQLYFRNLLKIFNEKFSRCQSSPEKKKI